MPFDIVINPKISSPGTGTQHFAILTCMSSYPSTIIKSDLLSLLISGEYKSSSTDISFGNTILRILLPTIFIPVFPFPRL